MNCTTSFTKLAGSTRHFLEVFDELNHLSIEFIGFREQIDTGGPLGRALIAMIGAIAELERSLIAERARSGMRRARLEGLRIGRPALDLDRQAILQDRKQGQKSGPDRPNLPHLAGHRPQGIRRANTTLKDALQKGCRRAPPNFNKTNGRVSAIRPFHKVWVVRQLLRIIGAAPA
jgi:DNA invertase Pin-like site-specific DNA recombinase